MDTTKYRQRSSVLKNRFYLGIKQTCLQSKTRQGPLSAPFSLTVNTPDEEIAPTHSMTKLAKTDPKPLQF